MRNQEKTVVKLPLSCQGPEAVFSSLWTWPQVVLKPRRKQLLFLKILCWLMLTDHAYWTWPKCYGSFAPWWPKGCSTASSNQVVLHWLCPFLEGLDELLKFNVQIINAMIEEVLKEMNTLFCAQVGIYRHNTKLSLKTIYKIQFFYITLINN